MTKLFRHALLGLVAVSGGCENFSDLPDDLSAENEPTLTTIPEGGVVNLTVFVEGDADEQVPQIREGGIGIREIGARMPSGAAVEFGLECRDILTGNETEFRALDPLTLPAGYVQRTSYSGAGFPLRFVCGVSLSAPSSAEDVSLTWKISASVLVASGDDPRITVSTQPSGPT